MPSKIFIASAVRLGAALTQISDEEFKDIYKVEKSVIKGMVDRLVVLILYCEKTRDEMALSEMERLTEYLGKVADSVPAPRMG